jgi:hypothetical protein
VYSSLQGDIYGTSFRSECVYRVRSMQEGEDLVCVLQGEIYGTSFRSECVYTVTG